MQALIFDVDGTIADTEEVHRQAFNAAFLELDLWWNWSTGEYMNLLKVSGGPERLEYYIDEMRPGDAETRRLKGLVAGIHRVKTRIYHDLIGGGRAVVRPGILRLVKEAREAGIRLALAATSTTSNIEALVSASLGRTVLGQFDAIASADEVSRKKPAPDLYLRVASQLRVAPADCVVIEDSGNGVRSAKAAGMVVVATPSSWTATQDFTGADLVLYSLGDPSAPLDPVTAKSLGAFQLGLAQLRALHAARAVHPA